MLELKLFKKEDLQKHYVFLQMPRAMIEKEIAEFKLSISEKFLYVLMLDRISLSAKNNWVNENGDVFMFYTLDEIAEQMECSKTTAKKNLDGLVAKNFVVKEGQGVGKANRIYLGNICPLCEMYGETDDEIIADNEPIIEPINKEETTEKSNNNVHTVTDFKQEVQTQTQQITGIDTVVLEQVIATVTKEVMKSMGFSGNTEQVNHNVDVAQTKSMTFAEFKKYTEETQHKTVDEPKKTINIELDVELNIEQAKLEVGQKIAEEKGLPKAYMNDKTMMNLAIKHMIDFDGIVELNDLLCKQNTTELKKKYMSTLSLYCDALTEMLTAEGYMKLGDAFVTANDVYDELQKYIVYSDFYKRYMIEDLSGDVQSNFNKALDTVVIKNKMKYIQTCIWNSLVFLADKIASDMAELEIDIEIMNRIWDNKKKEELENKAVSVEKIEEVEVSNLEIQLVDEQQEKARINEFYEEFTIRWRKLAEIDSLTDANKSQLNLLFREFSTDVILETLDKVLEDTTLLKKIAIYYFVFDFNNLKAA